MKTLLLIVFSFCFWNSVSGQTPYWQQQVNFRIDANLNDANHTIDGYVKMEYINNSPDTLHFIWIQLWPNAYKNDRTAFTDQDLENGSTDFYFSENEQRGYINRLNFKVNSIMAKLEDHPQHQDIVKLILPTPLTPGSSINIESPFHLKLPYPFSRAGHIGQSYQVTQWYPKPAVYDRKGWHPMPYLDQGEFYSEFGNYEVQLHLPGKYIVAATGLATPKTGEANDTMQTLVFKQDNIHDFAWFADPAFIKKTDTLQLPSGKIIQVQAFYFDRNKKLWANSIANTKRAILSKSNWLGEYPYPVVSVVDDAGPGNGGMEYPTITLLSAGGSERMLDFVINHEVGHNWFYGILATHERMFPWMDEGMNTFYDSRYSNSYYGSAALNIIPSKNNFFKKRLPEDYLHTLLAAVTAIKQDQPINTPAGEFSVLNYNAIAYAKSGEWMQLLEKEMGREAFDKGMQEYYRRWMFKHPYPEDFRTVMEESSRKNLQNLFSLLDNKGPLKVAAPKKDIRVASFFSLKDTDKYNYIFLAPSIGYNFYDKLMLGAFVHNYTIPFTKFQFFLSPQYATGSKQLNGIGRLGYSIYPGNNGQKLELSVAGSSYSADSFTDSANNTKYLRATKLVPSIRFLFGNRNRRSTLTKFIQFKTFGIREQGLAFMRDTINQIDVISYPQRNRYLNQLKLVVENNRVLYPYTAALQVDQGDGFVRAGFTGNYHFNYVKKGGLDLRFFAGKFFYTADQTGIRQLELERYHLNMTGPKGYEDYSYSNYFVGRNEFKGFSDQQLMIRDGAFKVRTDLLNSKVGKTDDWLAALNFNSTIPDAINPLSILPVKLPLKVFLDIGTYAEAWKKNSATGKFIYDAGLQLSLFSNVLNVYVPILYSKVYSDYFKSTITEKRFIKNIAFSIDLQHINLRKLIPQTPL